MHSSRRPARRRCRTADRGRRRPGRTGRADLAACARRPPTRSDPPRPRVTFGRASIDLDSGSRTQSVSVTTQDTSGNGAASGVAHVRIEIAGDHFFTAPRLTLASGTSTSGTWHGTFAVSKYAHPGTYRIQYLTVTDADGNLHRLFRLRHHPPEPGRPVAAPGRRPDLPGHRHARQATAPQTGRHSQVVRAEHHEGQLDGGGAPRPVHRALHRTGPAERLRVTVQREPEAGIARVLPTRRTARPPREVDRQPARVAMVGRPATADGPGRAVRPALPAVLPRLRNRTAAPPALRPRCRRAQRDGQHGPAAHGAVDLAGPDRLDRRRRARHRDGPRARHRLRGEQDRHLRHHPQRGERRRAGPVPLCRVRHRLRVVAVIARAPAQGRERRLDRVDHRAAVRPERHVQALGRRVRRGRQLPPLLLPAARQGASEKHGRRDLEARRRVGPRRVLGGDLRCRPRAVPELQRGRRPRQHLDADALRARTERNQIPLGAARLGDRLLARHRAHRLLGQRRSGDLGRAHRPHAQARARSTRSGPISIRSSRS